ncbi:class I SAM-dependent methyltransferase [Aquimarina sp. AU58]|uniref:class I SAM-dependent methyltransferase n=1 Tax=Aquimarina sp. AU58 TaxID=1874112 RepID=UPI000D6E3FE4|nr:class I SAM-dependent methyltransferase [Aquimarina sp. AU58]
MLTNIFAFFLKISPRLKRAVWKKLYEYLSKKYPTAEWTYMNYGYESCNEPIAIPLNEEEENDRYMIQLYHYVATAVDLADKDVVEVGSGRGGGSSYIKRYLKPKTMVGIDYSKNAIKFSNTQHSVEGLTFIHGDAENLPLENESADAIVNVESSHCYGSMKKFVKQVNRVLRPGGYFLFADLRPSEKIEELDKIFNDAGFEVLKKELISKEVVNAMDAFHEFKLAFFQNMVKGWLKKPLNDFAGVKGSNIHKELSNGKIVYYHYVLRK